MSTTIFIPPDCTPLLAYSSGAVPTPIATTSTSSLGGGTIAATVQGDFVFYVPATIPEAYTATIETSSLMDALVVTTFTDDYEGQKTVRWASDLDSALLDIPTSVTTLTGPVTIWVPWMSGFTSTLDLAPYTRNLEAVLASNWRSATTSSSSQIPPTPTSLAPSEPTATTVDPSSSPTPIDTGDSTARLSAGAGAGIGIAVTIVSFSIAGLLAWKIWKRRVETANSASRRNNEIEAIAAGQAEPVYENKEPELLATEGQTADQDSGSLWSRICSVTQHIKLPGRSNASRYNWA